MVLPILAAGAIGAGAAILGGLTKKEQSIQYQYAPQSANVYHQPYENFAPSHQSSTQNTYAISPQYSYAVQIQSPNANITQSKKDETVATSQAKQAQTPTFTVTEPISQGANAASASGIDPVKIALIGGAVLVGIVMLKKGAK